MAEFTTWARERIYRRDKQRKGPPMTKNDGPALLGYDYEGEANANPRNPDGEWWVCWLEKDTSVTSRGTSEEEALAKFRLEHPKLF